MSVWRQRNMEHIQIIRLNMQILELIVQYVIHTKFLYQVDVLLFL